MKLGTETNSVVTKMITRSGQRPRHRAAIDPNTNPMISASRAAMPPSVADTENDSEITSEISRPVLSEMPKSPCARLPR